MEHFNSISDALCSSRFTNATASGIGRAGHPLGIDGCLIMICVGGNARLSVNSRDFHMMTDCVAFLTFDMVVVPLSQSEDFTVRFISVNFDTTQDIFFMVTSGRFWDFVYTSPVFRMADERLATLQHWFKLTEWVSGTCSQPLSDSVMRKEVENFMLVMADQLEEIPGGRQEVSPPKNRAWTIVNDFIGLLCRHYSRHHDVAFYARRLNVTPNYLNIIIRRNTGITAKEHINIQIGQVIRTLLDTTDLSVKQIAARLHYEDPSYLSRIFRKQNGMSPIAYRNKLRSTSE